MSDGYPSREERLGVVTGDRLCTGCGYNLLGQPTVREPHYRLVIIRCPECGAVAAVQEYPLLGRWANRWGAVLAAIFFILLVAAWPASSGAIFGWSMGAAEEASWPYTAQLQRWHREADAAAAPAAGAPAAPATPAAPSAAGTTTTIRTPDGREITLPPGIDPRTRQMLVQSMTTVTTTVRGGTDFEDWWAQQDPDALFARAGGWSEAVEWEMLVIWIPLGITALLVGWFWSIALLQLRRRWVLAWGMAIIGLSLLFSLVPVAEWMHHPPPRARVAAGATIGIPSLYASLAFAAVMLMTGMLIGRPATRGLVRALLPPRMRGSLAVLWTAEGREVPGTARLEARRGS